MRKAVAGGNTYHPPRDYGVMYGHGFQDLDGHIWELMYMDPAAVQTQPCRDGVRRGACRPGFIVLALFRRFLHKLPRSLVD